MQQAKILMLLDAQQKKCSECTASIEPHRQVCSKICQGSLLGRRYRGTGRHHIRIRINGTRVYYHRFVYEQEFGPIPTGHVVHHRNDDRFDNRPENLELLTMAEHLAAHDYWRDRRTGSGVDAEIGF